MDTNRREYERSPACLPVWVTDGNGGPRRQGQAVNISAGGIYVLIASQTTLSLSGSIKLTIGVPSDDHGGYDLHDSELHVEVVRTEHVGYAAGLALKFQSQFQRMDPQHLMMPV